MFFYISFVAAFLAFTAREQLVLFHDSLTRTAVIAREFLEYHGVWALREYLCDTCSTFL